MSQPWRGIFPIVITPFTDSYELDEAGLRNVVRYCIEAGARAGRPRQRQRIRYAL